jgi:hypothetical protein
MSYECFNILNGNKHIKEKKKYFVENAVSIFVYNYGLSLIVTEFVRAGGLHVSAQTD